MSKRPTRIAQETADFDRIVQIITADRIVPTEDDLTFLRVVRERIPYGPRRDAAIQAINKVLKIFDTTSGRMLIKTSH